MPKSRTESTNTQATRDPLNLGSLNNDQLTAVILQSRPSTIDMRYWCSAEDLANALLCPDLIPALAAFIREKRRTAVTDNISDRYC